MNECLLSLDTQGYPDDKNGSLKESFSFCTVECWKIKPKFEVDENSIKQDN